MANNKTYNPMCKSEDDCRDCNQSQSCVKWTKFIKCVKIKKYAHFDKKIKISRTDVLQYIMNPNEISKHGFYPFIHVTKTISKFKNGEKQEPKNREIFYCSHRDRCVYQRYAFLLNQQYNEEVINRGINSVAIAYRDVLKKNNINFAKEAFDIIKDIQECTILVGDFSNFFDELDHAYLKKMICELLKVTSLPDDYYAIYKNITKFSYVNWKDIVKVSNHNITDKALRKTLNSQDRILTKTQFRNIKKHIQVNSSKKGIPQGSPISAVLSNIYMLDFDTEVNSYIKEHDGYYMRYSDDFIIVLPAHTNIRLEQWIAELVKKYSGIILHKDKTNIYKFDRTELRNNNGKSATLDYLGFIFDGKTIKIRPKSITKYYYRMNRKAKHIGKVKGVTPKGNKISGKKLYKIYSKTSKKNLNKNQISRSFINYAERAISILDLNDHDLNCLVKRHKEKIKLSIKQGYMINDKIEHEQNLKR